MKRTIKLLAILAIFVLLINIFPVYAATASASLKATATSIKRGNEFKVTLSVNAADGINGISTDITYDNTVLELVSSSVTDSSKWSNLSGGTDIDIMAIPLDDITSSDMYVLTFRVLNSAAVGSTTTISTGTIEVDTYLEEDATATVGAQSVTITVAPDEGAPVANTETPTSSSSSKKVENIQNDKTTTTSKKIAYAGLEDTIYVALIGLAIVSVIIFLKYKKYKDI